MAHDIYNLIYIYISSIIGKHNNVILRKMSCIWYDILAEKLIQLIRTNILYFYFHIHVHRYLFTGCHLLWVHYPAIIILFNKIEPVWILLRLSMSLPIA